MPSLYCAGVRIHLALQPLAPTLTEHVQLKKGSDAASKSEQAEKALRESVHALLPEERVPFPGDDGKFAVNWLGDAPFLQTVVGESYGRLDQLGDLKQRLASSNTYAAPAANGRHSSRRLLSSDDDEHDESSRIEQLPTHGLSMSPSPYTLPTKHQEPKALVLHVMLSDKTFFPSPLSNSPQHLKIDVLFNGQLSSSALIHTQDIRTGAKSLNQVFAGARIDYMAERPWVMHTPRSGAFSRHPAEGSSSTSVQARWEEIQKALIGEAEERGVDVNGERPPTARYLRELANMQMPDMVRDLQKPGGMKFGVIDVIITVGIGKKTVDNAAYLKSPTRLSDDRFCYEANGGDGSESYQAHAYTSGPLSIASDDQDAEGESDHEVPALTQDTIYHGLPIPSSKELPPLPLQSALPWHNPFTGSPIRPLAPLEPPTSFVRGTLILPGASEPPQKRGRFQGATDLHSEATQQMPPPRPSYPSAHGPSIPPRSSYTPSVPQTGFNVNQYDSSEHANPYQLPYAGMMAGLDFANFDGPAYSPLRYGSGGQLTLPSFMPMPEEVIPSPSATSEFSSPYSQPSAPPKQGSSTVFSSDNSIPYGSMGYGIFNTGQFPHASVSPGYALYEMNRSPLGPLGLVPRPISPYASVPYMPPLRRPSNGPPPPLGFFKVTKKPKTPPMEPKAIDRNPIEPGVSLRRLVIRVGARVVVSHHFTAPRLLHAKASLRVDAPTSSTFLTRAREESPGSVEWVEQADMRRPNKAAVATPSNSTPNAVIDLTTTKSLDKTKRDSIHDGLTSADVSSHAVKIPAVATKGSKAASTVAKTSVSARIASGLYVYAPVHRTAETGILGVQGPKANLFVFDNPEELLRKKKSKAQGQSRSASPTKVDAPADVVAARSIHTTEFQKVDQPIVSKGVDTGSSSPLSELSNSPQLSVMAEAPQETNANVQVNTPELPFAAVPARTKTSASLHASGPLSMPASELSAPLAPSMLPASLPIPRSVFTTLKRKRASEPTPRRTSAGAYIKQPRSPDRLNAKENSPLNKDCVVQYAVSERQGGGLRQVKSERKGVFKEENVVVGCRFFVSGVRR
ncbi:hypothetical protein P171DRAFT_146616 [Karstenula rhodostoma CBS 690.94]|uniref:Uncharacterized protein n=1 Tax=Karstenula rhodostoma CBS 690.94 TaxID=1392251 RepID=A0A9P4PWU7_9PLEO|nr:hypothetical protein P171DRAFT_146616 [Karstenula rhodostoma CBS 690.94]